MFALTDEFSELSPPWPKPGAPTKFSDGTPLFVGGSHALTIGGPHTTSSGVHETLVVRGDTTPYACRVVELPHAYQ